MKATALMIGLGPLVSDLNMRLFWLGVFWGVLSPFNIYAQNPSTEFAQRLASTPVEQYAPAPGYSEGPTWRKGEVFFCSGALLRVDTEKKVSKYLDIGPAGTYLRENGDLLVCDNKNHALLNVGLDGTVGVVADSFENQPLLSLNDLTVDPAGNIYWTDPEGSSSEKRTGRIFRVTPEGTVERLANQLAFPNGIEVDPAGKFLYIIESQSQKILRYALPAVGQPLSEANLFYDLGGSGGDGCAFDADGNLWVADFHRPDLGKGRITVLSPTAQVLGHLVIPAKVVSNITFGGPEGDEIYCTTGEPAGVFRAAVKVKGFKGHPAKTVKIQRQLDIKVVQ